MERHYPVILATPLFFLCGGQLAFSIHHILPPNTINGVNRALSDSTFLRDISTPQLYPKETAIMTYSAPASNPATSAKPKVKNIPNPRRLLVLTPTTQSLSIIPPLLHSLTGVPVVDPPQQPAPSPTSSSTPPPPTSTFAGYTTHSPLRLEQNTTQPKSLCGSMRSRSRSTTQTRKALPHQHQQPSNGKRNS
jgi:hypothetical protein